MKRIITTLALAAVLTMAVGVALAQDDRKGGDDEDWGAPPRMMDGRGHGPGMHGPGEFGMRGRMGMGMGMGGGMFLGPERLLLVDGGSRLADELDLTGTQRDRLRDIGGALARKEIKIRADLETAGLDLRELMRSGSPSASQVDAKIDDLTQLRGEMMKAGARAVLDARKVLTNDQRKKLDEIRPGRFMERRERQEHRNSR